jgi:hypothetical protein
MSAQRKKKVYVVSKQKYTNTQRKIAFFSRQPNGLYFEVGGFFMGSHTSYHKDGNIFRTSPATGNKARKRGVHIPLKKFKGWYQLGTAMLNREALDTNPGVEQRDLKKNIFIHELDLDMFPSRIINVVVELIEPEEEALLNVSSVAPPPEAKTVIIKDITPWIILTFLGHENNLLIKPEIGSFTVSHFNSRFSTNRKGVKYGFEVYGNSPQGVVLK